MMIVPTQKPGAMIVPTLCVGMHTVTLCVTPRRDAERPGLHSHAERGNDQREGATGFSQRFS